MAHKKLRQLKLNLYSPGSGLTKLKVRESNSTGWYVMSRQSPLGSSGTWLYMLPTRAHSMFSGNNNTSYRLTAYLCKNSARGGIWNALVLFFEITSFRYVPLAAVVFSYQFCSDGKFYYRAYLVCHSQMPSLQVASGGGYRHFFPDFPFFKRQCDCICVSVWLSFITPRSAAKEGRHVFIKKKEKSREWKNDRSLALCYWNILTALGSLTFYYKR